MKKLTTQVIKHMLWFKALHLIFMVAWFAGLLYLPRLFVYHSMSEDHISKERFEIMESRLFYSIMTPAAVLTVISGGGVILTHGWSSYSGTFWLHTKLFFVAFLVGYHIYCGRLLVAFKSGSNKHSHVWYRWFNEIPALCLIVIILLAVLRPF